MVSAKKYEIIESFPSQSKNFSVFEVFDSLFFLLLAIFATFYQLYGQLIKKLS